MIGTKRLFGFLLALAIISATAAEPNQSQLIEQGHYKNKSGQDVHSPAHSKNGKVPQGASAQCRDGTYSFSKHHSGTCSGHGGVVFWLN